MFEWGEPTLVVLSNFIPFLIEHFVGRVGRAAGFFHSHNGVSRGGGADSCPKLIIKDGARPVDVSNQLKDAVGTGPNA